MKKIIRTSLFAVMASLALVSCSDEGNNTATVTYTLNETFNYEENLAEGTSQLVDGTVVKVAFNYDYNDYKKCTADIGISNVPLGNDKHESLVLNKLPMTITAKGTHLIEVENVSPAANRSIIFNKFTMEWADRRLNDGKVYSPVVRLSYTVNNAYSVNVVCKQYYFEGTTTVTPPQEGAKSFTDKEIAYVLTFDPKTSKASLSLLGAKFAEAMPVRIDMNFDDIAATFRSSGYGISSEVLIPSSGGKPFPMFEISNLSGRGNYGGNFNVGFTVKDRGHVQASLSQLW